LKFKQNLKRAVSPDATVVNAADQTPGRANCQRVTLAFNQL